MAPRGSVPALLIAAAVLAGQTPTVGSARKTATIDGVLINSVTHAPIKKAVVVLRDEKQQGGWLSPFVSASVTDAAGRFGFSSVEAGKSYTLRATAEGFISSWEMPGPPVSEPRVKIGEDQHVAGVSLSLEPYRVISGKVLDTKGNPLYYFDVRAIRTDEVRDVGRPTVVASAYSDDQGSYRIPNVPPGRYFLQVVPPNFDHGSGDWHWESPEMGYSVEFYPGVTDISHAEPIDVSSALRREGADIRLQRMIIERIRYHAPSANPGLIMALLGDRVEPPPWIEHCPTAPGSASTSTGRGEFRIR